MLSKVKSLSLHGLEGYLVEVQVDISNGMPCWDIVGLPDASVKEAKERVRTAIKNSGFDFLSRKIVVNLAPADLRKEGTYFDLPIAIGILLNMGVIKCANTNLAFVGELSLDGVLNRINGILPICIEAKRLGIRKIILPKDNAEEGSVVDGIEVIGVSSIKETINYLNNKIMISPEKNKSFKFDFQDDNYYNLDFSDVKGQTYIKRALEIATAGSHNCLLIGAPRSRKDNACKENSINHARFNI